MAIGERIHFFRTLRNMTMKSLGKAVGFQENGADVRIAQYESGTRTPKETLTKKLADALDVSPQALDVPDIDSYTGLMHTFFTLEDIYGFKIDNKGGNVCLSLGKPQTSEQQELFKMLWAWRDEARKLEKGKIDKETYDQWRYRYPELDTTQNRVKMPSEE